jgi:hypothetical protein
LERGVIVAESGVSMISRDNWWAVCGPMGRRVE